MGVEFIVVVLLLLFCFGYWGFGDWQVGYCSVDGWWGVSIGVIVVFVVVVVMVVGVILWCFFGDVLFNCLYMVVVCCVGGKDIVVVIVDLLIVDQVKELVDSYNVLVGLVGDCCVVVVVILVGFDVVINGFIGKWLIELGGQLGLWILSSFILVVWFIGVVGS